MATSNFSPESLDMPLVDFTRLANKEFGSTLKRSTASFSFLPSNKVEVFATARLTKAAANGRSTNLGRLDVTTDVVMPFEAPRRYPPAILKSFSSATNSRILFRPLQRWEGYVLSVGSESFLARLLDTRDPNLVEEAEIDFEEVTSEDREFIREGAVFYWKIEYQDRPSGRQRASDIRFRRLPKWTPEQMEAARQEAVRVSELIGWE